jgi:hypothetical protein
VCLAIVLRYCVLDTWLLRRWDEGWRPWRANAMTILPGRRWVYRAYAFAGGGSGYRRRVREFLRGFLSDGH